MNKLIIYIALGVVLLAGLFYFLKPQESPEVVNQGPAARVFEFSVADGRVITGPSVMQVTQGDAVKIRVVADEDNELHVHGYDVSVEFGKGQQAEVAFTAHTTGRFEVELERPELVLGNLEVLPK